MTELRQTLMRSFLLFYPHTALLWIASSLQKWFSVTHGWKWKGQCSNEFLNSFPRDRICYFLPCSFGITEGSTVGFCWWASFYNPLPPLPRVKHYSKVKELESCMGIRLLLHAFPFETSPYIQVALKPTTPATSSSSICSRVEMHL